MKLLPLLFIFVVITVMCAGFIFVSGAFETQYESFRNGSVEDPTNTIATMSNMTNVSGTIVSSTVPYLGIIVFGLIFIVFLTFIARSVLG